MLAPSVPAGHILLQAGLQLEWLTNGLVAAGMHEVVVSQATANAVSFTEAAAATTGTAAAEAGGEVPGPPHLWRVSSTMFAHANSAVTLRPLLTVTPARLSSAAARDGRPPPSLAAEGAYPSVRASEQVMAELRGIALAKS
mmetsp:Transcript_25339/g.58665  ORF Transcript_25339/g.58665 Transcript_25339/m.58665 type:complete len:141 (+) Transcript_25339:365-787(+)